MVCRPVVIFQLVGLFGVRPIPNKVVRTLVFGATFVVLRSRVRTDLLFRSAVMAFLIGVTVRRSQIVVVGGAPIPLVVVAFGPIP